MEPTTLNGVIDRAIEILSLTYSLWHLQYSDYHTSHFLWSQHGCSSVAATRMSDVGR